jgi:hypothetical protein
VQTQHYASFAKASLDLRHAAQAKVLCACVLAQGFVGVEAQVRRLYEEGEHMKIAWTFIAVMLALMTVRSCA